MEREQTRIKRYYVPTILHTYNSIYKVNSWLIDVDNTYMDICRMYQTCDTVDEYAYYLVN